MKTGTKSLFFGVHQFVWHPYTVYRAWCKLYGKPTFKQLVCIVVHDWGYFGKANMDGPEGILHPIAGANIALKLFGRKYYELCLYHSRSYVEAFGGEPSMLCWADKQCALYDPRWFYLFRAKSSGELKEYRMSAAAAGIVPIEASDKEWHTWLRDSVSAKK